MKRLAIFISLIFSFSAFADLFPIIAGTYKGKMGKKEAELYLTEYPGRDGSFMGVIISKDKKAHSYLVDKFGANTYGMIPLQILENGVLGFKNSHPSLVLKMTLKGSWRKMQIISAGSLNNEGFKEGMEFSYKNNVGEKRLGKVIAGTYKEGSRKHTILVGSQDRNNESYFTANAKSISGDFVLREVRPGLHLPFRSSLSNTGIEVKEEANSYVLFIDKECLFGTGTHLLRVDTRGNVSTFKKM